VRESSAIERKGWQREDKNHLLVGFVFLTILIFVPEIVVVVVVIIFIILIFIYITHFLVFVFVFLTLSTTWCLAAGRPGLAFTRGIGLRRAL
jgi:hypothetical protein